METRQLGRMLMMVLVVCAVSSLALASKRDVRTSLTKITDDGRLLYLTTGTGSGDCQTDGSRVSCRDGASFAGATLAQGCDATEGSGYCLIVGDENVTTAEPGSSVDVTCGSGAKKGRIYTMTDGDGRGSCGADRGVDDRINGATCTKNGQGCATMSCDEGCISAGSGCECHERSTRVSPMNIER